jgi:hypothetical protein
LDLQEPMLLRQINTAIRLSSSARCKNPMTALTNRLLTG